MPIKFSIRYKILSVVSGLLLISVSLYVLLATKIFRQDKTAFVYSSNKVLVTSLASQYEALVKNTTDKLRLFALLVTRRGASHENSLLEEFVSTDPNIVRVELFSFENQKIKFLSNVQDSNFLKTYNLNGDFYTSVLEKARAIPFDEIQEKSVAVWNATIKDGPPLIGVGLSVIIEGPNKIPERILASVGYIKADEILRNIKSSQLTNIFILDSVGKVIVHRDPQIMMAASDFSTLPIVGDLERSKFNTGAMKFEDSQGNEMLGAYAKVGLGKANVVSQTESRLAFEAVNKLAARSILFGAMIITATFLATILFSRTLTRPLNQLLSGVERVSSGDLESTIAPTTKDEIAVLTRSFNQMMSDLKASRSQLQEINRDLEQKVVDRTKKLEEQNRAVQEAQEALLRTTRLASVGEIAGRTAHEVLNPLTSLMARLQKVERRLNDTVAQDKEILGDIVKGWKSDLKAKGEEGFLKTLQQPSTVNKNSSLLLEDLTNLDEIFSRWDSEIENLDKDTKFLFKEASRIEIILKQMRSLSVVSSHHSIVPIHSVLNEATAVTQDLFSKAGIHVTESYKATSDKVKADSSEILQVLTNLLRNSLQAITENRKPGWVLIETSNTEDKIQIDIVDNGIGVSEENRGKLFVNQFSTKDPTIGTGLGLSISRRFVRAVQGDLFLVSSTPGVETRFRIVIPAFKDTKEKAVA